MFWTLHYYKIYFSLVSNWKSRSKAGQKTTILFCEILGFWCLLSFQCGIKLRPVEIFKWKNTGKRPRDLNVDWECPHPQAMGCSAVLYAFSLILSLLTSHLLTQSLWPRENFLMTFLWKPVSVIKTEISWKCGISWLKKKFKQIFLDQLWLRVDWSISMVPLGGQLHYHSDTCSIVINVYMVLWHFDIVCLQNQQAWLTWPT